MQKHTQIKLGIKPTRSEARARHLQLYWADTPCKRGHPNWRLTCNGICYGCNALSQKKALPPAPDHRAALSAPLLQMAQDWRVDRAEALELGLPLYFRAGGCSNPDHAGWRRVKQCDCYECSSTLRPTELRPLPPEGMDPHTALLMGYRHV